MQDISVSKLISDIARNPEMLREISPREFEGVVAELLAANGYHVQLTPPTRDGGYDVMAVRKDALGMETTTLVECKRYAQGRKVPVSVVRGLYGVKSLLGVSSAVLVTNSQFSEDARKFVEARHDMQLIEYTDLLNWFRAYVPSPDAASYSESRTFYSCFISHSSKDRAFVEALNASLRDAGVRVWYAPEDLIPGRKLRDQIKRAINSFDKVILVLSSNSMSSDWVVSEIRDARSRERRERRQVLFPISIVPMHEVERWECFDADTGTDLASKIREYFVSDFSAWKDHNSYGDALKRLIAGLRLDPVTVRILVLSDTGKSAVAPLRAAPDTPVSNLWSVLAVALRRDKNESHAPQQLRHPGEFRAYHVETQRFLDLKLRFGETDLSSGDHIVILHGSNPEEMATSEAVSAFGSGVLDDIMAGDDSDRHT